MRHHKFSFTILAFGLAVLSLWATAPAYASGYAFFEQGAKAAGMSGAFTAQADDASALFHNAGGMAFFEDRKITVGGNLLFIPRANFRGVDPVPGSSVTGEQQKQVFLIPHFYIVQPLSPTWKVGFGVNSPFGLQTKWKDPDNWAGRFLSTRARLYAFDLNPNIGWQITPKFGIGGGAIFRLSTVELQRRVPAPTPLLPGREIGRVRLKSDTNVGYGWNIGMLHKPTDRLSWGFSYRSRVKIDYTGNGRFSDRRLTGVPPVDTAITALIPFDTDLPISTSIRFPDQASLGVAYAFTPSVLVETDVNWTGWHRFRQVNIHFNQAPRLNSAIPEEWKSVFNYRVGLRWTQNPNAEWRFGYFFDTTPQPAVNLNPLLPDANRNGISAGYGFRHGRIGTDLYAMYVPFYSRTTRVNRDNFNGTYKTDVLVLGLTLNF